MSVMSRFVKQLFGRNTRTIRNAKPQPAHKARLGCEGLEAREVPAAFVTASLSAGVLTVDGTNGNDNISVNVSGNYITVAGGWFNAASVNSVVINGLDGNDGISNNTAKVSTVYGGAGDDSIVGGSARDILVGGDGNDWIYGAGGDDFLCGAQLWSGSEVGPGADTVYGGTGNDTIYGGDGNDFLDGQENDDTVLAGNGNDTVYGTSGNDALYGEQGDDTIFAGTGNDTLNGGTGNDHLDGQDGDDWAYGDTGDDALYGGLGNDTLYGGTGNDWFYGDQGDDFLDGQEDNDTVYGGTGNDTIYGGAGNDFLDGQEHNDTVFAGAGSDTVYGGAGDDLLLGEGGADRLDGGAGADSLYGGDGDDTVAGGLGNDALFGGNGGDQLSGGAGDDRLSGEAGDDTLVVIDGGIADLASGGDGFDTAWRDKNYNPATYGWLYDAVSAECVQDVASFANGADRTLDGDNIADPNATIDPFGATIAANYQNFATNPLFADGGPAVGDVVQQNRGDCWLMGTAAATASANPQALRRVVADAGDGTYLVRLGDNFYRVDADLPTWGAGAGPRNAGLGRDGCLWVAVVEKAYALYRTANGVANSYRALDGGSAHEAAIALGLSSVGTTAYGPIGYPDPARPGQFKQESNNGTAAGLGAYIRQLVDARRNVAIFTDGQLAAGSPLVTTHCYAVTGYSVDPFGAVTVNLRNPWGVSLTRTAAELFADGVWVTASTA